jgi:hypothetical protein
MHGRPPSRPAFVNPCAQARRDAPLPARLGDAGNLSFKRHQPETYPAQSEIPEEPPRPSAPPAAVVPARGELWFFPALVDHCFSRHSLSPLGTCYASAPSAAFLFSAASVWTRFLFSFYSLLSPAFWNGMPISSRRALPSSGVFAVVQIVMSMPFTRDTLSRSISRNTVCSLIPRV